MLLLSLNLKFQLEVLNIIVYNYFLYFIYTVLIIYCFFCCLGNIECNLSHIISLIIVLYLQETCIEINFLCKIAITRRWIIKLVGQDYFIANFPSDDKLVLRYFLPVFFLFIFKILSMFLILYYQMGVNEVLYDLYKEVYGVDV